MEIDRPEPVHARDGAGLGGIGDVAPGNGFGDGPATELAVDQPPELNPRIGVLRQVAGTGPLFGAGRRSSVQAAKSLRKESEGEVSSWC